MSKRTFLTKAGFEKIRFELDHVRNTLLPRAKARYDFAKSCGYKFGDHEFDESKEVFEFFQQRVVVLQGLLDNARLIGEEMT